MWSRQMMSVLGVIALLLISRATYSQPIEWTSVTPPADSGAVCSRGEPYTFYHRPGSNSQLMIYFQGGGACWDAETCAVESSSFFDDVRFPEGGENAGIFDLGIDENPLQQASVVYVTYCTGDVHIGDATVSYGAGDDAFTIEHRGVANARAALNWTFEQYPSPEQVIVTGSSAGGYGAIYHAASVLEQYPDADALVVADASLGISHEMWDGLDTWNAYANIPDAPVFANISERSLTTGFFEALSETYPDARLAAYSTTLDFVQVSFYGLQGGAIESWPQQARESLARLSTLPAFRAYLAEGSTHTILSTSLFYDEEQDGVRFVDWFTDLVEGRAVRNIGCPECEQPE